MKKYATISNLIALLLLFVSTNSFAQKIVKPLQLSRKVTSSTIKTNLPHHQVLRVKGIYLPKTLTNQQLESKIRYVSYQNALNLRRKKFKQLPIIPNYYVNFKQIFKGKPLPYAKGQKVLEKYFKKFEEERAKNTYEEAWATFMEEHDPIQWHTHAKAYVDIGEQEFDSNTRLAQNIYDFHVYYFGTENLLHIRNTEDPTTEAIVCAIPVNGFTTTSLIGQEKGDPLGEDSQFVIRYDTGNVQLAPYDILENNFCIIK